MSSRLRVLCFGDSNTWGYIPITGGRYPDQIRWTGRLAGNPDFDIIEEGLNGRTTAFVDHLEPFRCGLDYVVPCLLSHFPLDVVIVMLGTNDTKRRYNVSAPEIARGLEEVIIRMQEFCRRKDQHPEFVIISPARIAITEDVDFDQASVAKALGLEAEYRALAEQYGCRYLKASDYVTDIGQDGVHLTETGHKNLADAIEQLLLDLKSQANK